jgi:predicted dehydrogenase
MATIGCHLVDLCCFVVGSPIAGVCADFTTVHRTRYRPTGGPEGSGVAAPPPEAISCGSEEVASVLVRFASGARGVLGVSRATAGRRYKITVEVDGTDAALAWDSEAPNQLWQGQNTRPNQVLLRDPSLLSEAARRHTSYLGAYQEAFADTIKGLLRAVYQRILDPARSDLDFPTLVDGHAAQLVHEAVMESARSRRWVDVPG